MNPGSMPLIFSLLAARGHLLHIDRPIEQYETNSWMDPGIAAPLSTHLALYLVETLAARGRCEINLFTPHAWTT
jgi:hypothetical protein